MVIACIAMCFAITALGLGARHGCSASTAGEPLSHHHDGGNAPVPPMAQCDCVGHACCYTSAAPPTPGLVVAFSIETPTTFATAQASLPRASAPHSLPYATAPPVLAA